MTRPSQLTLLSALLLLCIMAPHSIFAQMAMQGMQMSHAKYFDNLNGKTADELVTLALADNGELIAIRKEAEAAEQLIRQARLRADPSLNAGGAQQLGGGDNSQYVQTEIPLEIGGRRSARVRVAERELEIRRQAVAERERQIAAEVRIKFGESLAAVQKLMFIEEMLALGTQNFDLVAAKVTEGRTPPLERNMEMVELNRVRAMRESSEGTVQMRMFELRNLAGMQPEETLRLKGSLETPVDAIPPQATAVETALKTRPDLAGARAVELLAAARAEQARSEGRMDADVMFGYERMKSSFPLLGIQDGTGALLPIDSKFNFFTFGVRVTLPVRNRNQGAVAAALLDEEAARSRREFGELTIRREVASAYARYDRALRAREIYRVGVREQAAANLAVVRETYELGSKTLLDYIAEHHRFMDTEIGYVEAQLETYLAGLDVLRAVNSPELTNK